jgi:hypothetical protein
MHHNGTATLDRPEVSQVSPVVGRANWIDGFEEAAHPLTLRIEFPLSVREVVAALYHDGAWLRADDLATTADVWRCVALALTDAGMDALDDWAREIENAKPGEIERPEWLAFVRQRVADVTGGAR